MSLRRVEGSEFYCRGGGERPGVISCDAGITSATSTFSRGTEFNLYFVGIWIFRLGTERYNNVESLKLT